MNWFAEHALALAGWVGCIGFCAVIVLLLNAASKKAPVMEPVEPVEPRARLMSEEEMVKCLDAMRRFDEEEWPRAQAIMATMGDMSDEEFVREMRRTRSCMKMTWDTPEWVKAVDRELNYRLLLGKLACLKSDGPV